jgi:endonuclease-3 related protein
MKKAAELIDVYQDLYDAFGAQHWWPGETRLEVIVGAILTQNTAWQNVERAILNMKREGALELGALQRLKTKELAALIKPSGYYNIKAERLKGVVRFIWENGGIESLRAWKTEKLRDVLLEINGVGEETADSILLYAFNRPVFVVDAYTKRILSRLGFIPQGATYAEVKGFFERSLPKDVKLYNEFHALIVRLGKDYCWKSQPFCGKCPVMPVCVYPDKL